VSVTNFSISKEIAHVQHTITELFAWFTILSRQSKIKGSVFLALYLKLCITYHNLIFLTKVNVIATKLVSTF
jgi:hypothetical protein